MTLLIIMLAIANMVFMALALRKAFYLGLDKGIHFLVEVWAEKHDITEKEAAAELRFWLSDKIEIKAIKKSKSDDTDWI